MTSKSIVVIDDEEDTRRYLADLLAGKGYDVTVFENPLVGFKHIYEHRPDLVILDRRMPSIDGLSLLPGLRAVSFDTPVLLLTAHGNPKVFLEALEKGACEMLSKPFHEADLLCTIRRILRETVPAI